MKRIAKVVALLLVASTLSCMGGFGLTRTLYGFNQRLTGSSVVNHLVFWALVFILPIYELAVLGDLFILNVIEYWTGARLIASVEQTEDGGMRVVRNGETFEARPVGESRVEVWKGDEKIGAVEMTERGDLIVNDVHVVSAETLRMIEPTLR